MIRYLFLLLALLFGLFHRAYGTIYYLDTAGNNSSNGLTPATAWKNLWRANDSPVADFDTIYIMPGVYGWTQSGGDTADYLNGAIHAMLNPRTGMLIKNRPGYAKPTIRGSGFQNIGTHKGTTLYLDQFCATGRTAVTLESLLITNSGRWSVQTEGSNALKIRYCDFDSSGGYDKCCAAQNNNPAAIGQGTGLCGRLIVHDCTFRRCYAIGINMYRVDSCAFYDNVFYGDNSLQRGGIDFKMSVGGYTYDAHVYDNLFTVSDTTKPPPWQLMIGGSYSVIDMYVHNNVFDGRVYSTSDNGYGAVIRQGCTDLPFGTHTNVNLYNNTFVSDGVSQGIQYEMGSTTAFSNWSWFNNLFYTMPTATGVTWHDGLISTWGGAAASGCSPKCSQGYGFYWNYNGVVDTNAGHQIIDWSDATRCDSLWTPAEWYSHAGYGQYDTMITSISNIFVNRAGGDYRLHPSAPNYLKQGGRGGSWPTYVGAFPASTDSCPSINRDSVPNGATTTDITPNYVFDITDSNNDSVYYKILRDTFNPPTTVRFSGTVATPANNITHTESGLADRTTYHWRIAYTDTVDVSGGDSMASCVGTTSVYSYFVDTVKCPTVTLATPANGATVTQDTLRPTADFLTDGYANIIARFYGEATDVTPDVLLYTDTLTTDSTGWNAFKWTGLVNGLTYYWQIVAQDPDCTDSSTVRNFTVNLSAGPPTNLKIYQTTVGAGKVYCTSKEEY